MSTTPNSAPRRSDFPVCKAIYCSLPDDGTDKRVLVELRKKQGIIRAGSATLRGIGVLAEVKTKRGKLPEPDLVKQVYVICSEDQADEIFELIFRTAQINKPGRGMMLQRPISSCTPYELPADIPDEETGA